MCTVNVPFTASSMMNDPPVIKKTVMNVKLLSIRA